MIVSGCFRKSRSFGSVSLQKSSRQGFTLIELSIVLVIIGLIVGGVLVGQSLIRAAELHSVIKDITRFETAVKAFQGKYDAIPGDMANATRLWGVNPNCGSFGVGSGTQTCDGNGNRRIDITTLEMMQFWQHLSNAGMLEGAFTGVPGNTDTSGYPWLSTVPGVNAPASRIGTASYGIRYLGKLTGASGWYDGYYLNIYEFGSPYGNPFGWTYSPVLKAEDAYRIDSKMDDGLPASGKVRGHNSAVAPGCTTSDTPSLAAYNNSNGSITCSLIFDAGF